jgi:hypothetical protein
MDVADSFRDGYEGEQFITQLSSLKHSNVICNRGKGGNVYLIDSKGYCLTTGDDDNDNALSVVVELLEKPGTMVLCRSNKQVRKLQSIGIENVSTVHQAKGLEYTNVILCDMIVNNTEELNVAYVGMTRAKDNLCVINYDYFVGILARINVNSIQPKAQNSLF